MFWAPGAKERAVTRRQVIVEAMAGKITWGAAAEILQMSLRSVRRLKWGYKKWGFDALYDRRRRVPSPKRAAVEEVERVLRLYGRSTRASTCATFTTSPCATTR
jgi:transposase